MIFVRPGSKVKVAASSYHVFGSGLGHASYSTTSKNVEKNMDSTNNGFIGNIFDLVTLNEGEEIKTNEWYDPGGSSSKVFLASKEGYRNQRRESLIKFWGVKKIEKEYQNSYKGRENIILDLVQKMPKSKRLLVYANWIIEYGLRLNNPIVWHGGPNQPMNEGIKTFELRWEVLCNRDRLDRIRPPKGFEDLHKTFCDRYKA